MDGQQRVRAILDYVANVFPAYHPEKGRKLLYRDLSRVQQQTFLMTSLPIGFLLGANDADVIEIFGRINSVSKSLNTQEKRNAKFSGDFKQFALKQAAQRIEFWRSNNIFTSSEISRMGEVQFLSDLVMNMVNGLQDFGAARLDKFYASRDDEFPEAANISSRLDRVFNALATIGPALIKETLFRRQPIFFSMVFVLDESQGRIDIGKLGDHISAIDRELGGYELSGGDSKEDFAFIKASSSTTQRIAQRRVRNEYLREKLS
ncbi:MAG: hypothetical protein ACREHG_02350 [Candidatus Saccharimonadales bacterium]